MPCFLSVFDLQTLPFTFYISHLHRLWKHAGCGRLHDIMARNCRGRKARQAATGYRCLFWGVRGDRALKILEWANAKIMRNKKCWCQTINPENLESGFLKEGPQERQLLLALLQAPNASCPSLCTPREHYQFWKGDTPRDWGGGVILWSFSSIHPPCILEAHPPWGRDRPGRFCSHSDTVSSPLWVLQPGSVFASAFLVCLGVLESVRRTVCLLGPG